MKKIICIVLLFLILSPFVFALEYPETLSELFQIYKDRGDIVYISTCNNALYTGTILLVQKKYIILKQRINKESVLLNLSIIVAVQIGDGEEDN